MKQFNKKIEENVPKSKDIANENETQLTMELQEPFSNKLFKIKGKFTFISQYFEVKSFFRNPWVWGLIIITISIIAIQIYYLQFNFNFLPEKVPLLTMYINLERRLFDRTFLIAMPAVSAAILTIAIFSGSKAYYVNKILSVFTLILSLIATIVITFGLARIISYYLI